MIRPANQGDAPRIAAIWTPIIRDTAITFWPTPRSEPEITAMIRDRQTAGHAFLVETRDNRVTGFASTSQFRPGGGYVHTLEHTVHVAPAAQGAGIGRALMIALQEHALAHGARVLIGAVTASNTASLAFHARLGFDVWGRIPDAGWKFGRFHDLVLVGKKLG